MQEPKILSPHGGYVVREEAPKGQLPPSFLAALAKSDAVLMVSTDDAGRLGVQPVIAGGLFQPEAVASHALVDAVYAEMDTLMRRVNGKPTDGQRFAALRDFAVLAHTDPARFEVVNGMIKDYEELGSVPPQDKRSAEDFEKWTDFLVHALAETAPVIGTANPQPAH